MEGLVVKITELNPQLEMEIRDLLADMGRSYASFEGCELFARMDQSGHVLGIAYATSAAKFCHLLFVAVRPDARGEGTGSMIINHVLSHYAGLCDAMYLLTEAEGFFERFGFMRISNDRLPEEIRERTGGNGATVSTTAAMLIELPGHWTRK